MNQQKEMTQMVNSAGKYLAPRVRVKELRCRRVLCQSDGGTNKMTFGSEVDNDDFE